MKKRKAYPDDLTDQEWKFIESLTENKKTKRGRKPKYGKKGNAQCYFLFIAYRLFLASSAT